MKIGRRELILGSAAARAMAQGQPPAAAKPRTAPIICVLSKHLAKLHYSDLGPVIREMGFEGCDLTVREGGHVIPQRAPADMVRAIEGIRDEGVLVPMITTGLLSAAEPWARNILAIAGGMKVPFFKPGYWRYSGAFDIEARLTEVKREVAGLMLLGRTYNIAMGLHNHAGDFVGEAVWDNRALIGDLDPRWAGYYFDPGHATAEGGVGGWSVSLQLVLPRLKMVALNDFYWSKESGAWKMKMCPMGEGMVDWPKIFAALARVRFTGPLSLHMEYEPKDEIVALTRDLEFVKKQVGTAYAVVT